MGFVRSALGSAAFTYILTQRTLAPTALPDVDDTAKAIAALRYLDRPANPDALLHAFETESHFRTYQGERNPSFSSNCNVLISLLILEDPTAYVSQIVKAANFLCKQVINGDVIDKWVSDL